MKMMTTMYDGHGGVGLEGWRGVVRLGWGLAFFASDMGFCEWRVWVGVLEG
jgi:hypothetical protein